ncbi:sn-glycerol-3-phosphate ABC transporter permease component [Mesoplasma florum W37]|uniref:N-Acetyl-D-glucosamine ABC transport system, permease protein 1 n=1 Tax=Mesoplasma florum TaxID=2151 RepID=A0AAD2JDZ9_MESFO|nr:sugar ABC transporter permease [Mesoplasma florum]AGY41098.1 sn-glycerol-3-phosphate ABC transporter permease component [Mesoplasma florum W37]AVN59330.1 sugar ABC transporter permease [Mesoplasma florum]AVN60711.1 sugar ABC transporter permease [Mesoplasma florum]AVN65436.1 N-Acetyl-D-glucosamine ABC transport system, permease protein 1 [Mesoplasma florum]
MQSNQNLNKTSKSKKDKGFILRFKSSPKSKNMEKGRYDLINQLIWITPGIAFVCIFSYFSMFIVFRYGLSEGGSIGSFVLSLQNIKLILFQDETNEFTIALRNTFIYVVAAVPISLFISLFTAKALSNLLNKKAYGFFQSAFFLPYVTSSLAVAMVFATLFLSGGDPLINSIIKIFNKNANPDWREPKNTMILLIIFGVWKMLPFKIIMFTAAFLRIDRRLYQAASLDGTPKWQQFWKISLPQILPVIIYMITTGIIGAFKFMPFGLFNNYDEAKASAAQTAVYYIFDKVNPSSGGIPQYGKAGAASIVLMILILAMTLVNRQLTKYLNKKFK